MVGLNNAKVQFKNERKNFIMKIFQREHAQYVGKMLNSSVELMENELDKTIKGCLPGEVYEDVYDQVTNLEALHNEFGFRYGYMIGFLTCLNINDIDYFELKPDEAGDPVFSIRIKSSQTYDFELKEACAIAILNSWLINFENPSNVKFKNYGQYMMLISSCNEKLNNAKRNKAKA